MTKWEMSILGGSTWFKDHKSLGAAQEVLNALEEAL